MRRPNFIVLGQGKAGTSLIWRVMRENPSIAFPKKKELHFFNKGFDKGLDWYDGHFADLPQDPPYIGEVSPSYLDPDAVQRVAGVLGADLKVVFVLRRPIEQAFSRYMQNLCATPKPYSFERYDRFMGGRLQKIIESIQLCLDLFGADNVLPLFYERHIQTDQPSFEARILEHLGLPEANHAAPFLDGPRVNPGVRPHYLYDADQPILFTHGAQTYEIPPDHLVLCAQKRNSSVLAHPDEDALEHAANCRAAWTTRLTKAEYADLQARRVLPAADQLEAMFGYDMSHWRNDPIEVSYDPAPPPPRFAQ